MRVSYIIDEIYFKILVTNKSELLKKKTKDIKLFYERIKKK